MSTLKNAMAVRVIAKTTEAVDICSFELVGVDGEALPAFSAGSHVDVQVNGHITRQYSLCNDPSENHRYLIAVLRDAHSRGGSEGMHEGVNVGDTLTVSAPKNHFPLQAGAQRSLLFAGGIGITPILCMAERLAITGADFEMHYCTRSRERTAFVERISTSSFAAHVHLHFDDGAPEQKAHLDELLSKPAAGTHLYVCGPKGFMDAVLMTARAKGWDENLLHSEFFTAQATQTDGDDSFQVRLASSGRVIVVPADKTVVQAMAEAGIDVPTSCEQGICGTCLTRVLEGEIDHRDQYLTAEEQDQNDQFTPCCSRAKSAMLVLDL